MRVGSAPRLQHVVGVRMAHDVDGEPSGKEERGGEREGNNEMLGDDRRVD